MTSDQKIDELLAVEAIRKLMANYCHGIDGHDLDLFMNIWTDDAEYRLPRGNAAGIDEVKGLVELVWKQVTRCQHNITNQIIEVDGDTATAKTNVFYYRETADGLEVLLSGGYDFRFVRTDGVWKVSFMEFWPFVNTSPIFAEKKG